MQIQVGGAVQAVGTELEVRVDLANRGSTPAARLEIEGELLGSRRTATLGRELPPGGSASLLLRFPSDVHRPGVHALALHLHYPPSPGDSALASQRAFLLLALGANPEPALRLTVPTLRLDTRGRLKVGVESADGRAHRVRLRVLAPRGLNAPETAELDVPPSGQATAEVVLLRAGVPRDSRQGILVVAGVTDGAYERDVVGAGVVEVLPDPARLPRLRWALVLIGLLLLLAAVVLEVRRRVASSAPPPRGAPPPLGGDGQG